jgi:hypothetical protein
MRQGKGWRTLAAGGASLAIGLTLTGCSQNGPTSIGTTYEVKGQVLLADGSPLPKGRVTFLPTEPGVVPASGEVGPSGEFSLTTKATDDGAMPGEYKVRIEPAASLDRKKPTKPPFPLKYIDEDSSGIVVVVKAGANRLDPIRLK